MIYVEFFFYLVIIQTLVHDFLRARKKVIITKSRLTKISLIILYYFNTLACFLSSTVVSCGCSAHGSNFLTFGANAAYDCPAHDNKV